MEEVKEVKRQKLLEVDEMREVTPEAKLAYKLAMWAVHDIRNNSVGGKEFDVEERKWIPTAWYLANKMVKEDFPEFTIVISKDEENLTGPSTYYFETWKVDKLNELYDK